MTCADQYNMQFTCPLCLPLAAFTHMSKFRGKAGEASVKHGCAILSGAGIREHSLLILVNQYNNYVECGCLY